MKATKLGCCVVLVVCVSVGTAGCGIFDLITAGMAAAKLFGGAASDVTAAEWELMTRTAANAVGQPDLALSSTEAAAIAQFLADNNIDDLGAIGDTDDLQGLDDLADAFQSRADEIAGAGVYDLNDPDDAEAFFEAYGQELADGLAETLADLGIEIPNGDG